MLMLSRSRINWKTLITLSLICIISLAGISLLVDAAALPKNGGAVDVMAYGAKGDGVTDDTEAIQRALEDQTRFAYLPNGTYLVCDTLKWGNPPKRRILQGESRERTIIRLRDNCPGFDDPKHPKPVITTFEGKSTGVAFRNAINDLTLDVGSGNPGAIGIRFTSNNQGGIRNVTIQSSDPDKRGATGLALTQAWPGPATIEKVRILGFDYGIMVRHPEYSIVFEDLVLKNQKVAGIDNSANILSIQGIKSENSVPAIQNVNDDRGMIIVLDGNFSGGSSSRSAIENQQGVLYARNIRTSGYQSAIKNGSTIIPGSAVDEYVSQRVYSLFPTPHNSLRLPVEQVPTVPDDDFSDWVSITEYGAKNGFETDDTAAIQKAIDSGKSTVYFPHGNYRISDTIYVRGNVKRIIGMESAIQAKGPAFKGTNKPVFRIEDGKHDVVRLERFWSMYGSNPKYWIEQADSRTLVIKNIMFGGYRNTVPGRLFLEDVTGGPWEFNRQKVWARQLNPEGDGRKILNNGGTLWILGLKTEDRGTAVETINGGKTEVLGGLLYPGSPKIPNNQPAFLNNESQISVVIGESYYGGGRYQTVVKEIRDGTTKVLKSTDLPQRGRGTMVPLYVGYKRTQNTTLLAADFQNSNNSGTHCGVVESLKTLLLASPRLYKQELNRRNVPE